MNILIVGQGGREHAIAQKLSESKSLSSLFISPGNPGTAALLQKKNITGANITLNLANNHFQDVVLFCKKKNIHIVIIGPENFLAQGLSDALQNANIPAFGPSKKAAQLESSKFFAKKLMQNIGVPTPPFQAFSNIHKAREFIHQKQEKIVLKADGLALGKGVIIPSSKKHAISSLDEFFVKKKFKDAGNLLLIEDFLPGNELSLLAFCDGTSFLLFPPAKDYKRAYDNDEGLNTGGMGAYAPANFINQHELQNISNQIFKPVLQEMQARGTPFKGILYAGLIIHKNKFYVLEFNVRFGDPEAQCLLPLLQADLITLIQACIHQKLSEIQPLNLFHKNKTAVNVVLASKGYPQNYQKGFVIKGLNDTTQNQNNTFVFHSGTKILNNNLVTNGGRVVSVTTTANSLQDAQKTTYEKINSIQFQGAFFRKDIGN